MAYAGQPEAFPRDLLPRPYVDGHPDWTEMHDLAWRIAFKNIFHREGTPAPWYMHEGMAPRQIWQWDSCLMALFCRYLPDIYPGVESLDNFYGYQAEDGYISMSYLVPEGAEAYGCRVNPPLFAWAEWLHYETTGRAERLARVLPLLVRYFDWIKEHRTRPNGAYWYTSPGAGGMDNSPRQSNTEWDGGMMGWVDLTAQQALSARYLTSIASLLGEDDTAARFEEEFELLRTLLNDEFWCMRSGFYHDIFSDGGWLSTMTLASYWPVLAGVCDPPRAQCMADHLLNPREFNRPHRVPSLSAADPNYMDDGQYWRGGVWPPTNYMVCCAMKENGFAGLALEIATNHLEMIARTHREVEPHTIWECYAPEWAGPSRNSAGNTGVRPDFVGWAGLGPISMFYECILGVDLDVPNRRLVWTVANPEEHGVERLPFGEHRVTLHSVKRQRPGLPPTVRIEADCDLEVVIRVPGVNAVIARETVISVKAGERFEGLVEIPTDGCIERRQTPDGSP